jgi:ribonucleoside-diphosphate reductase alpha chain
MKDYYWLNEDSIKFLKNGYLQEGVEPQVRYRQIAETAEKILLIKGFADKFESYIKKGWYSLSSPIIANFGLARGLPISCNGSYVDDSMTSILEKVGEVGMMTKYGAGTSLFIGNLRPRGSSISVGGKSSGAVHFMGLFDAVVDIVSQSNVRRGSCAVYLPIEHPDIKEFLKIRSEGHPIQHLSIGITITDKWMQEMVDGDKEKRTLWGKVIQKRCETGYPYIFFTDTVNNNAPQVYKDKGLKISASNLCLKGDSIIEIKFPFQEDTTKIDIESLVNLWNMGGIPQGTRVKTEDGFEEITSAAKTGDSDEMIRITDDATSKTIECTPEHLIYTKNRGWVMAKDLVESDELLIDGFQ